MKKIITAWNSNICRTACSVVVFGLLGYAIELSNAPLGWKTLAWVACGVASIALAHYNLSKK